MTVAIAQTIGVCAAGIDRQFQFKPALWIAETDERETFKQQPVGDP